MTTDRDTIELLERRLLNEPPNSDLLCLYHKAALAAGAILPARQLFETLFLRYPESNNIGGFYIALCIELQDYDRALKGVQQLLALGEPDDHFIDAALSVLKRRSERKHSGDEAAPQISLCMIIKDEARHLGRFLYHARELADDLVVVDTGSSDRSIDIARLFDARTFSFTWCQDFAAARNYAIDRATGRWIMVLDADEMIAPQDLQTLRRLTEENDDGRTAFSIETRNYCNGANIIGWHANDGAYGRLEFGLGWFGSTKVRLFPRRDDIRFHFAVHERVEPSLKRIGVRIVTCTVPVHHYGHLDEAANRRKALAYYELGCMKLEQMRGDLPALRELAVQAGQLERWSEAIRLWQLLFELKPNFVEAHVNIANAHWQMGNYESALAAARTASQLDPHHPQARFNSAVSLLLLGKTAGAAQEFKEILARQPDYLPAIFMSAVVSTVGSKRREAGDRWTLLEKRIPASALRLAKQDLARRFMQAGLKNQAAAISDGVTFF